FVFFVGNSKKKNGLESGVLRPARFIDNLAEGELKNTGHARDRPSFVDLFADEERQHEIVRGEIGFANQVAQSWRPAQPSWTMNQFSHVARLRIGRLARKFAT